MNMDIFGEVGEELSQGQRVRVKKTGAIGLIHDLWDRNAQVEFVCAGFSTYGVYYYREIAPLTPLEQLAECAE